MMLDDHGGGCCGILHLFGLGDIIEEGAKIKPILEEAAEDNNLYGVVEAVATDSQLKERRGNIAKELKKNGFVLINRVQNPNTGNYINIFHKFNDAEAGNLAADSPYNTK